MKLPSARMLGTVLTGTIAGTGAIWHRINRIPHYLPGELRSIRPSGASNPLFRAFPALENRVPWMPLGHFPTPLETLVHPQVGTRILLKRDDRSSEKYGGNKVRKLEFLLADALLSKSDTLITMGGHGSNHALATALHGQALGFRCHLFLYPQPDTPAVRRNYAAMIAAGATVHPVDGIAMAFARAGELMVRGRAAGRRPYFVLVGGSSRLGGLGHVAAALEFAEQIREAGVDPPERVFVPLGTCGTAVGLIVGFRLAGIRTRVTAVRVADPFPANATVVRAMANDLSRWLASTSPRIPRLRIEASDFDVVTDYFGPGYGVPTAVAEQAVQTVEPMLALETTYTGKTLAACLDWIGYDPGMRAVFWNTYNSAPLRTRTHAPGPDRLRHLLSPEYLPAP